MNRENGFFRNPYVHAAGLFLAAMALRCFHLGKMSFWYDEILTVRDVSAPLWNIYEQTVHFSNPPLFHFLVRPFYLVFGKDDFWLRFPCAFFGALTVPLIYFIGRRLLSPRVGLAAAAFMTLAPFHIWYSQEFRMYSLAALVAPASLYLWIDARETDSRKAWWRYALISIVGIYTHYWFLFILATQMLWLLVDYARGKRYAAKNLLVFPAIGLSYVPWIPAMIRQTFEETYTFLLPPAVDVLPRIFQAFLFGLDRPLGYWAAVDLSAAIKVILYAAAFALPALGAFWPGAQRKRFVEIYLVGLVIPLTLIYLVSVFVKPVFVPHRYTVILLPAYALSVARLAEVRARLMQRGLLIAAFAWLVVTRISLDKYYFQTDKAPGKMIWARLLEEPEPYRLFNGFVDMPLGATALNYYSRKGLNMYAVDRLPSKKELAAAQYDLIVLLPARGAPDVAKDLFPEWEISSRRPALEYDIVRFSRNSSARNK